MGKPPGCDINGLKKGPWSAEEDQKLIDYIQKHGHGRWRILPKNAGLKRCGKSCRLRWTNYLRPDIKRGKFSVEEDELIIQLHSVLGNKWSAIAARLPGRTDNEIKNYWNTRIRKKLLRMGIDPITHTPRLDLLELSSLLTSSLYNASQNPAVGSMFNANFLNLATSFISNPTSIQQNQIGNYHCQNQNQSESYQDNNQIMQANLNHPSMSLPNLWQLDDKNVTLSDSKGFLPMQNYGYPEFNQSIMSSLADENQGCFSEKIPNLSNFGSILSTPSSSSTPLNSSSNAYVNNNGGTVCSTEDVERDCYCSSNMLIFDVPKGLNVNGCI